MPKESNGKAEPYLRDPTLVKKATATEPAQEVSVADLVRDELGKEAGRVLTWLNANACLTFGALPKALAAIERGDHRL